MKIQAAVTEQEGAPFALCEVELEDPRDDEVLVAVRAVGICHTDLIIRDQWYPVPLPAVLGHEGAGVVEAVGRSVEKVQIGDHVAMSYGSCGRCVNCYNGRPWVCHSFWDSNFAAARLDGSTALTRSREPVHSHFFSQSSFASHAIATERNVVRLDPEVPLDIVAPFGCGIQTGAGAVLNALCPGPGSSIVIFGTGTVGLAALLAARLCSATTIIGVDVRASRLELASELGATHVIDGRQVDAVEVIGEICGAGADFTIDCTGDPQVIRQAVYGLAPGGVCGLIGAPRFGTEVSLDVNEVMAPGRTIRGIVEGHSIPEIFLPRLIELWQQGRFPIDRIITHYEFDQIEQAARDAEAGDVIKPVLRL